MASTGFVEIVNSNILVPFTTASNFDMVIRTSTLGQRLFIGNNSNTTAGIIVTSNAVGINKVPAYALDVNTTARVNGANNAYNKLLVVWDGNLNDNVTTACNFSGFGQGTGAFRYQAPTLNNHVFFSGANEVCRVAGNNCFGIGTTNPTVMLDVNGPARCVGPLTACNAFLSGNVLSNLTGVFNIQSETDLILNSDWNSNHVGSTVYLKTGASNIMSLTQTQVVIGQSNIGGTNQGSSNVFVGIATGTPSNSLDIGQGYLIFSGTKSTQWQNGGVVFKQPYAITGADSNSLNFFISRGGSDTSKNQIVIHTDSAVAGAGLNVMTTGEVTRLFVRSSDGNVGIGTSNPGCPLAVVGGQTIGAAYSNAVAPTNGLAVQGNVGVGKSNPQYPLDLVGNVNLGSISSNTVGNICAGNLGMFRNRIINGDMRIAQRGTSLVGGTGTGAFYLIDRWNLSYSITTGGLTQSQNTLTTSDTPYLNAGFKYSYKITVNTATTSYNYIVPTQVIEGLNISDFNWGSTAGTPITLSFWLRTNAATNSIIPVTIRNLAATYCYNANVTVTATNTWQFVTLQIAAPPSGSSWNIDNTIGIVLFIGGFQTTTSSPGTWLNGNFIGTSTSTNIWATLNNFIELTGVQLEKGTIATPFEIRPYAIELQLCQRYHWQIKTVGALSFDVPFGVAWAASPIKSRTQISLPTPMRAPPILITSTGTGSSFTSVLTQPGTSANDISLWTGFTGVGSLYPTSVAFNDTHCPGSNPSLVSIELTFAASNLTPNYSYQQFVLRGVATSFAISCEL